MSFLINRFAVIGFGTALALVFGIHSIVLAGVAGFSLALAAVGAIYLGTLLGSPQSLRVIFIESAFAFLTIGLAVAGLLWGPEWLVAGYTLHAVWDWAHHNNRCGAEIASWYPPFCAVTDFTVALAIIGIYFT